LLFDDLMEIFKRTIARSNRPPASESDQSTVLPKISQAGKQ